ncbi:acyl-CoA dehydrogenase family protein [Salipiger aestuarii]|uniref:acyl-CoA dehydrogenase family protein n=1 Tax=Salipiger aestuarii TaxID=568098 RepID=UPI00123A431C|nr:acyl-CoA dehydrogenase family protein [Salipiger aestuarii]
MDDSTYSMVIESAEKLFSDRGGKDFDPALWAAVEEAGFPLALLSEDRGGYGFCAREAFAPVRVAAAHGVALPLGETLVANWALGEAGLDPAEGPAALAWEGKAAVPYGRFLKTVVLLRETEAGLAVFVLHPRGDDWRTARNYAGEARDVLTLAAPAQPDAHIACAAVVLRATMAMLRAVQIAGATDAVAAMCMSYCNEREQFGRPLSRLQAIQHQLAVLATQGCAATVAADMAVAAFDTALAQADPFVLTAAAAKVRAAEAATTVSSIAHQVHGAIGFSEEYPLHRLTCRLWSWRDEDGSEAQWARHLADWAESLQSGGQLWPALTACDLREAT